MICSAWLSSVALLSRWSIPRKPVPAVVSSPTVISTAHINRTPAFFGEPTIISSQPVINAETLVLAYLIAARLQQFISNDLSVFTSDDEKPAAANRNAPTSRRVRIIPSANPGPYRPTIEVDPVLLFHELERFATLDRDLNEFR